MRTFAQKPKATQPTTSAKSTIPGRGHLNQSPEMRSNLHLQRTIENPGILRLPEAEPDGLEAVSAVPASGRFGHDFSRIPVHAKASVKIQSKLAVSSPGDIYEQEADHVADRVMRMPEPQLQRVCACGGECPKCRKEQGGHKQLQTKHIKTNEQQLTAPPIVKEVTRSPGEALDLPTRKFMETRFGYDFSQVRIHADALANEAARAVHARAFTLGRDIVFGAGQHAPNTHAGRQILAHELTHVVQQTGSHASQTGGDAERSNDGREKAPIITNQAKHFIQTIPVDCDQEQIECFRRCWEKKPPWPIDKGGKGHYIYCQSKCLAEYMACIGRKGAEFAFASMASAVQWLADHPEVVVGTIVVVAGVTFIVASGGTGLVLVPAAASDRRLKHSIKLIGVSPKGLNIYTFKYKDTKFGEGTWQGVLSDEIPNYAVIKGNDGFDRVDYRKLDVCFAKI